MGKEPRVWSQHNIIIETARGNYLLNLCSGASYEVTKDIARVLTEGHPESLDDNTKEIFMQEGIIVEESLEKSKVAEMISESNNPRVLQTSAFVIPTYQCNLHCRYCFQHLRDKKEVMTSSMLERAFEIIHELGADKAPVTLFGGEPLLPKNFDLVEFFCNRIEQLGLQFRIITNGVALGQFKKLLVQHRDRLEYVQVTIDGSEQIHNERRGKGSYRRIMESIQQCYEAIPIVIRVNTDFDNIDTIHILLEEVYARFPDLDTYCAPVRDSICGKIAAAASIESKHRFVWTLLDFKKRYTRFGTNGFRGFDIGECIVKNTELPAPSLNFCSPKLVFDPKGLLFPCVSASGHDHLAHGQFWPELRFFRNWWSNRAHYDTDKCRGCNLILVCGGGCSLEHETGYMEVCKDDILRNISVSLEYYLEQQ